MTRLVNAFATLSLVLALSGGASPAPVVQGGANACGWCSTPEAINLQGLRSGQWPAETAVFREGARTNIAVAGRSLHLSLGGLPAGLVVPALVLSGILAIARGPSVASAPLSSSSVRGPPLTI